MSNLKAKVEASDVLNFLKESFDPSSANIITVSGGETSQAFKFNAKSHVFIIRLSMFLEAFYKDKYAYENFVSDKVLIPKVFKIDKYNDLYFYCISQSMPGKIIDDWDEDTQTKLYPRLNVVLDEIHATKILPGRYGWWNIETEWGHDSWREYILERVDDPSGKYEKYYLSTFLERDLVEKASQKIKELITYIPEERSLIHGDYAFSNVLTDGENITGVLDWGNSAYGDYLFDLAYIQFWEEDPTQFIRSIREHQEAVGKNIENYDERMMCYLLRIGIGVVEFWARAGLSEKYEKDKNRLLKIINAPINNLLYS